MSNKTNFHNLQSLLIVIVNYRTPTLVIDCLASLQNELEIGRDSVVVVDNASNDYSVKKIKKALKDNSWQSWVKIVESHINGGFAHGNNQAIRPAIKSSNPPSYILLLNPDTIIRQGALKKLVEFMEENPQAGIAGSRLENPDGSAQCSAFRFPTIISELDAGLRLGVVSKLLSSSIVAPPVSENICQTDWVAGASMIVRSEVFEQAGLIDESYFLYYEEVDFCLQAQKAGWSCWYVPESKVVHFVGQSSGIDSSHEQKKRMPKYWFESRRRYFVKNYGWFYAVITDLVWSFCYILWHFRRILQNKSSNDPPNLFLDFVRNSSYYKFEKLKPPKTS